MMFVGIICVYFIICVLDCVIREMDMVVMMFVYGNGRFGMYVE